MPRALMTPGREDLSPWPPVGQLSFDQITAMDEATLDRAFKERHGLDAIFKSEDTYNNKNTDLESARRLEVKRITLARLEGYSLSKEMADWVGAARPGTKDEIRSVQVSLSRSLTEECKKRIHEVASQVERRAATLVPPPNLLKMERRINAKLYRSGLPQMSLSDIFNPSHIPPTEYEAAHPGVLNMHNALIAFEMRLNGHTVAECAERFGISYNSFSVLFSIYFSEKAKQAMQVVRKSSGRDFKDVAREG